MEAKRLAASAVVVMLVAGGPLSAPWTSAAVARQVEAEADQADEDDDLLREMMIFSIPRDSAAFYADLMDLDELQREIAMEMYRDYYDKYRDGAVTMRDVVRSLEEKMESEEADWEQVETMMRDMMKVAMGFLERSVTLGEQYIDDLGALAVGDAQQAAHERVVRTRAREMAVAMSSMQGGGPESGVLDLVAIGRGMDPPLLPSADGGLAAETLLEYERELGVVCAPFVDRALQAFRDMTKAMSEGDGEMASDDEMEEVMESMIERIGAINERTARRVHNALPPERQGEWDLAYKRARWPQIYAPGDFHRTHEAAISLDTLTEDQRAAVDAAMAQYTREAETANKAWIDALADQQEARAELDGDWNQERWERYQALQEAVNVAQGDRRSLDERFIERIMKTLTPEQRQAMPTTTSSAVDADAVIRQMGGG